MKSILKQMRKRESSLQDQKTGIDHELSALRTAINAIGGKVARVTTRNYSHKPWTAERRRRFETTIRNKQLLARQKAARRKE
jgi:hypothetical protein